MNRTARPGVLDLQQPSKTSTRARSPSNSSVDQPLSSSTTSSSTHSSMASYPLSNVSPDPAYVAASAATGIVTSDHESFFQTLQDEGIVDAGSLTIFVTPVSLKLVNQFLDFLLYSILAAGKSTALGALRPAVSEVLRSRLAKEAIAGADQELQSYLGVGEGVDLDTFYNIQESSAQWDLEGTWKRTRLRCMVYSSLGDLEEDDEDAYQEFGGLEGTVGSQQYEGSSTIPGIVSPAVAIWLTSILEFVGEQTLLVAGHATVARFSTQRIAAAASEDPSSTSNFIERPMVEELDTEKVALNPSLGRMWRQWRKRARGGYGSFSIPAREAVMQRLERQKSITSWKSMQLGEKSTTPVAEESTSRDSGTGEIVDMEARRAPKGPIEELRSEAKLSAFPTDDSKRDESGAGQLLDTEKRRPQSLVKLSWTTESPFVLPSRPPASCLRRPHSLPSLIRGDFPDAGAELNAKPSEDKVDKHGEHSEMAIGRIQPLEGIPGPMLTSDTSATSAISKQEYYTSATGENQGISGRDSRAGSTTPTQKFNVPETASVPDETDARHRYSVVSPFQVNEAVYCHIGVARTSDVLVPPQSASLPRSPQKPRQQDVGKPNSRLSEGEGEGSNHDSTHCSLTESCNEKSGLPSVSDTAIAMVSSNENAPQTLNQRNDLSGPSSAANVREIVDATATSEDDGSIVNLNHRNIKIDTLAMNSGMSSRSGSIYSPQSKNVSPTSSKHSSQLSDRKLGQLTLVHTASSSHSISSDRGAGVRVWTPPTTPDKSRRSSSFSKGQRPIHTSGSGTSQTSGKLKGFMTWPSENTKHPKVHESDDESRSSLQSDNQVQKLVKMDDKERSFEELISSGGTIHCTITPDPIRNMEESESSTARTPTSELAEFFRKTGPEPSETRVSKFKSAGSRPTTSRTPSSSAVPLAQAAHLAASLPEEPPLSPPKSQRVVASTSGSASPRVGTAVSTVISSGEITGIPAVIKQHRSDSRTSGSFSKNSRLVARDASGSTGGDSTSALADFFRNTTPPVDGGEKIAEHRISRSVAPFRNTMDSTQFDVVRDTCEYDDISDSMSHELGFVTSSAAQDSYQSSFSSSTALLRSNSRKMQDYGSTTTLSASVTNKYCIVPGVIPDIPDLPSSKPSTSHSGIPEMKRKQRRVKDPYAIEMDDLDDDEDMDGLELMLPKKRQEESLVDFLRNVPPPPPSTLVAETTEEPKAAQKKSSSSSLIGRFGRPGRKNSIASSTDKAPVIPTTQTLGQKYIPLLPDSDSAAKYGQRDPQRQMHSNQSERSCSPRRRAPNRPAGPGMARSGRFGSGGTDSLADFLSQTGPPRSYTPPPKEETGLAKLKKMSFTRKPRVY